MGIYNVNGIAVSSGRKEQINFEIGALTQSGALANGKDRTNARSVLMFVCAPSTDYSIEFEDVEKIISVSVLCFSSAGVLIRTLTPTFSNGSASFSTPSGCSFVKFAVTTNDENYIPIAYAAGLCETKNLNIINESIGTSCAFNYQVTADSFSSGRLILPPNYSVDGDSVPLIVFVHGSQGMTNWSSIIGYAGSDVDYRPYLTYLANEGFAVFDCYPWSDSETDTSIYSPYKVARNIQAYLNGISFVCSRFNVNAEKVNLLCKSQGGHLGQWACTQTLFPFKTISLFAPSTRIGAQKIAFNQNLRSAIVRNTEFFGTTEEINTFISNGNYSNTVVKAFCDKNKVQFLNLMPFANGVTNASLEELYTENWSTLSSVPQWMLDEGLQAKPSAAIAVGSFSARSDYIKTSYYPVKFWCSFDDDAVSGYDNYAICRWMQNGGSDALFRELPVGTGGHHAMDTSSSALKKSGTTALGISYTNVPLAYTEVVDFIRLKCGD